MGCLNQVLQTNRELVTIGRESLTYGITYLQTCNMTNQDTSMARAWVDYIVDYYYEQINLGVMQRTAIEHSFISKRLKTFFNDEDLKFAAILTRKVFANILEKYLDEKGVDCIVLAEV